MVMEMQGKGRQRSLEAIQEAIPRRQNPAPSTHILLCSRQREVILQPTPTCLNRRKGCIA